MKVYEDGVLIVNNKHLKTWTLRHSTTGVRETRILIESEQPND